MSTNPLAQELGGVVLLPCPFCGAEMRVSEIGAPWHPINDGTRGFCIIAGLSIHQHHINLWNTRSHSAEIAGALRDAERYRWMRSDSADLGPLFSAGSGGSMEMHSGDDLDTAIDSAMQQGGGGG